MRISYLYYNNSIHIEKPLTSTFIYAILQKSQKNNLGGL